MRAGIVADCANAPAERTLISGRVKVALLWSFTFTYYTVTFSCIYLHQTLIYCLLNPLNFEFVRVKYSTARRRLNGPRMQK